MVQSHELMICRYTAANSAFKTALTHAQTIGDNKLVGSIKSHVAALLRTKGDLQGALNLLGIQP
jgi:hypothetical protein